MMIAVNGYTCTVIMLMMVCSMFITACKMKWYVVFKGRRPGVYNTWVKCSEVVSGFRGNLYQGFNNEEAAVQALEKYMAYQKRVDMVGQAVAEAAPKRVENQQVPSLSLKDNIIGALVVVVVIQLLIICNQ
jgi:hypothetical protein